jgi:hypothetical protein
MATTATTAVQQATAAADGSNALPAVPPVPGWKRFLEPYRKPLTRRQDAAA